MTVERSEFRGHVTLPKHDEIRRVPMTTRLAEALREHRHREDGSALTLGTLRDWIAAVCRRANLRDRSPHCLRGAPARALQELAGHSDSKTTQRYMHRTPAALPW